MSDILNYPDSPVTRYCRYCEQTLTFQSDLEFSAHAGACEQQKKESFGRKLEQLQSKYGSFHDPSGSSPYILSTPPA